MDEQEQTQSAELTRIESLLTGYLPREARRPLIAWMKNREATEHLLLGMLEKLTPAAETAEERWLPRGTTAADWTETTVTLPTRKPLDSEPPIFPLDEPPETPTTPAPAPCEHQWERNEWLSGDAGSTPLYYCVAGDWCTAIKLGNAIYLPQTQAPPAEGRMI